jgi:predicted aspartyl protease
MKAHKYPVKTITMVLISLLVFLSLESCKVIKVYNEMTAGEANIVAIPDTIPFKFKNGLIIVQVRINNQKEYDFIFDTGAPTIIWPETAQELGLEKGNVSNNASDGNGQDQHLEFFRTESLSVGKLVYNNMNMATINTMNKELACYANGGILGGNFLMHYNWQIDYKNQRLIACTNFDELIIPANAQKVEAMFTMPQGQILIDKIRFLKSKDYFIMDTGFTGEFELAKDVGKANLRRYEGEIIQKQGYSGLSTGGRVQKEEKYIKTQLLLPMDTLQSVILNMTAARSKMGNQYLSQYETITIHYTTKEKVVYFGYKESIASDDLSFGFTHYYDSKDNKFKIGGIYENSEAQKAGLVLDDVILSINNIDLSNIDFSQYCQSVSEGINYFAITENECSLKIDSNGEIKTVNLKKSPLFR